MLSVNNAIFSRIKDNGQQAENIRKNFFHNDGDHLTLLNIYNEWMETLYSTNWCHQNYIQEKSMKKAKNVREQLTSLMDKADIPILSCESESNDKVISNEEINTAYQLYSEKIRKSILCGFFYQVASLDSITGQYQTFHKKQNVFIHPSSSLFVDQSKSESSFNSTTTPIVSQFEKKQLPKWVTYFELVLTSQEFMRQVTKIEPEWLLDIAPHIYTGKLNLNKRKMPLISGKLSINSKQLKNKRKKKKL
jgi:pre-mRNA-splicing factor ATP-dependent RNA helicase DHX16